MAAGVDIKIVSETRARLRQSRRDIDQHVTPAMPSDAAETGARLIFGPFVSTSGPSGLRCGARVRLLRCAKRVRGPAVTHFQGGPRSRSLVPVVGGG